MSNGRSGELPIEQGFIPTAGPPHYDRSAELDRGRGDHRGCEHIDFCAVGLHEAAGYFATNI